MKIKVLAIAITLIMVGSTFVASADLKEYNDVEDIASNSKDIEEIRVAILYEEPIGWGSAKYIFVLLLNNYQWKVGNKIYKFVTTEIYDKDILKGDLNTNNYDVLLVPGGGVGDGEWIVKGFLPNRPRVKRWKSQIESFVKNGGGYSGYCGGSLLATHKEKKPETITEKFCEKGSLDISCVKSYYKDLSLYFSYPFQKRWPEKVGALAYAWFHCDYKSDGEIDELDDMRFHSGAPIDAVVNKNHSIFEDLHEDTTRMTWVGGPGFILPENPDREVSKLATYPEDGISNNESTRITAWRYIGGIRGLIKGFMISINNSFKSGTPYGFLDPIFYAGDWEPTDRVIDLNFSNKSCITAEIYPNENKGRIVLTAPHPEYMVWWGGHIESLPDTKNNSLKEGFHTWKDITPFNKTAEDEFRHAWWIIRRQVAWASKKVLDNDLPPVYGPSQVSDIYPYNQSNNFTIYGNSEISDGIESLDLYYQYSDNNETWISWTLYETDFDGSDGWSWEFNSPEDSGYYQFYSIRRAKVNEYEWLNETAPPGPDAFVYVDID
jgi:hypothetical protein